MLIRYLSAATLSVALLSLSSLATAGDEKPVQMDTHHVTITHQVEIAQTKADHEAIAKRFEDEASKLDKQAAEHEHLAKQYHAGIGVGPKGNAASLANHCDIYVKSLKASAAEARAMADMHRSVAQALDK
jgi:hypothetical protein